MTTEARVCPECGEPVVRSPGRGRPPKYCSVSCQRAAEYSLRRYQALIKRAERYRQDARFQLECGEERQWQAKVRQQRFAFWDGEVTRLKAELRQVLAGTEAETPAEYPRVVG